jgi:hypothetical protein
MALGDTTQGKRSNLVLIERTLISTGHRNTILTGREVNFMHQNGHGFACKELGVCGIMMYVFTHIYIQGVVVVVIAW